MSTNDELDVVDRVRARIDLHCHSAFSKDALGTLDQIAAAAHAKRLDGVCLAEHNTLDHRAAIDRWNRAQGDAFRFYPACEVSAKGGHILAYGLNEVLRLGLPVAEAVDRIHDQGGVAVPSHPFRKGTGVGEKGLDLTASRIPAIEVWNAQELGDHNETAAAWAVAHGKGGTGGSDAHQVHDVGHGYTEFLEPIETLEDLVRGLRSGATWGVGRKTPMRTLVRQATRNTWRRATGRL